MTARDAGRSRNPSSGEKLASSPDTGSITQSGRVFWAKRAANAKNRPREGACTGLFFALSRGTTKLPCSMRAVDGLRIDLAGGRP